jgi:membrane protein
VALRIVALCAGRFTRAEPALGAAEIAHRLETPIRLVRALLYELTQVAVLAPASLDGQERFQPAQDVDRLTASAVLHALETRGSDHIPIARDAAFQRLVTALAEFDRSIASAPANTPLKDVDV